MNNLLYFIELSEDENLIDYDKFAKHLSPEKQTQIHKLRFDIDKKLSLFSDLFVRYLACKILNLSNRDLAFSINNFGKPNLIGSSDFHYNISHTRNAIVIGISENPIGVDVEKTKPTDIKIAERFFHKNELNFILSKKEEQEKLFYEVWTKKEAYIKWFGTGLSMSLTSFDVTDIEIEKMFRTFKINDYIISVCSKTDFHGADVIKSNENQVNGMFLAFPDFVSNTV